MTDEGRRKALCMAQVPRVRRWHGPLGLWRNAVLSRAAAPDDAQKGIDDMSSKFDKDTP